MTGRSALKVRRRAADYWDMNTTGPQLPDHLTLINLTQHWVRLHGAWYRDAWVFDATIGAPRFVALLDEAGL